MTTDIDSIPFGPVEPEPKRRTGNNPIGEIFAPRTIAMLDSCAYRVLSLSAHRAMARLEIEFARRRGLPSANGDLICTHEDFVAYGLHHNAVAPALRELVALGFVEITEKGHGGPNGPRKATKFRLTFRKPEGRKEPTHEWRRIKTLRDAETIAEKARKPTKDSRGPRRVPAVALAA